MSANPLEPPQRRFSRQQIIELSDDEGSRNSPPKKRQRVDLTRNVEGVGKNDHDGGGGSGKGKQRATEAEEWYLDVDGDLLILDEPYSKGKGKGKEVKAGVGNGSPGSERYVGSSSGVNVAGGSGAGRAGALAFAGGSSRAAQDEIDPLDELVATITSIIPDVVPTYVRDLLRMPLYAANVEVVLEALLADPTYPRRDEERVPVLDKGKQKEQERHEGPDEVDPLLIKEGQAWVETVGREQLGKNYETAALNQLYCDFPQIQQANLKKIFIANKYFYAPSYIAAQVAISQTDAVRGYKLKYGGKARISKGKGVENEDFEKERKWVDEKLTLYQAAQGRAAQLAKQLEDEIASGSFFECGCCFDSTAFSQLVICSEGCQFCRDCAMMNAETQIGMRKYVLPCMSTSGCNSTFPESEAIKFLPRKTLEALHKLQQEKEIDVACADLPGLSKCPFCPWLCIIENDQERLFHCQRDECKIISCRECKKKDHLPKTCREVSEDSKIDAIHQVEEAMTRAMLRKCPKCNEQYIKEPDSCNKITCSNCRTLSCYLCQQVITGYDHFANAGANAPNGSAPGAICVLWDDTNRRNFEEVEAARLEAERIAREHPGISEEEFKALAMKAPDGPPARIAHLPPPVVAAYQQARRPPLQQAPRVVAPPPPAVPAEPKVPPGIPRLDAHLTFNLLQVQDLYIRAYEAAYGQSPDLRPHLDRWSRARANRAFHDWSNANAHYRRGQQEAVRALQQREIQERLASDRAAAMRAEQMRLQEVRARRERREDLREVRRKRTRGEI